MILRWITRNGEKVLQVTKEFHDGHDDWLDVPDKSIPEVKKPREFKINSFISGYLCVHPFIDQPESIPVIEQFPGWKMVNKKIIADAFYHLNKIGLPAVDRDFLIHLCKELGLE